MNLTHNPRNRPTGGGNPNGGGFLAKRGGAGRNVGGGEKKKVGSQKMIHSRKKRGIWRCKIETSRITNEPQRPLTCQNSEQEKKNLW